MRDVPETPFFSTFFGVLGGPLLQFKSPPLATYMKRSEMLVVRHFCFFAFGKYENARREDFLLDENNTSVL